MAVKGTKNPSNTLLTLEIDNGDLTKLESVMEKWSFKDYQSLFRFAISVLILTDDKSISIKMNGVEKNITPAKDLTKE